MTITTNMAITLVAQNQSQKEVTVNEAITKIDAILNVGAVSQGDNTPPGSPAEGDVYILGSSPTGAWATHSKKIAYYQSSTWKFIAANEGMSLWVNDEDLLYKFDGTNWISNIDNISSMGVNTTSDATNKLAVKSDAVLFQTNASDVQVKIDKATSTDTGSLLFLDGASGRAEIGLIANDDFTFKVSPDGSVYYESIVLDKDNGAITLKKDSDCQDNIISRAELKDVAYSLNSNATSGASATIDLENGNIHDITLTDNCTFTFSNPPATGRAGSFTLFLRQDATGGRTTTWPASVDWAGGSPPTLTTSANAVDILEFITIDGGTIWNGFVKGADVK
ncbi:DUF2793 domain-containing protein [Rickettsiales bacterium]|nr:DUF2793 domain-containing protein [Rickettsiales bacterium]